MSNNFSNKRYQKEINRDMYIDNNNLKNNPKSIFQLENPNILLDSVKFFFNAYEMKNQQQSSKIKFIITFEEIISLINETILAQQKVDNLLYNIKDNNNEIHIQKINQKFISYLSNSIYTLEIFDRKLIENHKLKRPNSNLNLYNLKIPPKKKKTGTYKSHISSPSNIKNKINYIFENIYQEVFINDGNPTKNNKKKKKDNNTKKNNINEKIYRTKSAILGKKSHSPLNFYLVSKNHEKELDINKNKRLFKTTNPSNLNNNNSNTNTTFFENKYNSAFSSNKKGESNNSNSENIKRGFRAYNNFKKNKKKEKIKKCSDIYMAVENISKIKNSGNMKNLKRKNDIYQYNEYYDKDTILKKSFRNLAEGLKDICNNSNEIIGYEEINLKGSGIKKIIVSNTHKPSNFTNKLLISGHKFIDNFKEMNEEEAKKKNNNNQF